MNPRNRARKERMKNRTIDIVKTQRFQASLDYIFIRIKAAMARGEKNITPELLADLHLQQVG